MSHRDILDTLEDYLLQHVESQYVEDTITPTSYLHAPVYAIFTKTPHIWKGYLGSRFEVYKHYTKNDVGLSVPCVTAWLYRVDRVVVISFSKLTTGGFIATGGMVMDSEFNKLIEVL